MLQTVRRMPAGIRLFLFYAFAILAGIGLSLRFVVDEAIGAPISGTGVVVMVLLAYTIFTTTLVLQRKEASRSLAFGLASLTLPLIPFLLVNGDYRPLATRIGNRAAVAQMNASPTRDPAIGPALVLDIEDPMFAGRLNGTTHMNMLGLTNLRVIWHDATEVLQWAMARLSADERLVISFVGGALQLVAGKRIAQQRSKMESSMTSTNGSSMPSTNR